MDAFCHFFFDDKMFNGYSAKENITPENGCGKDDIMAWRDGVVTRAVLYDMPQLKGVDWIEPGTPITRADLEAWEKKSGVKAGPGDVIMLYVGRWKRRGKKGPGPGHARLLHRHHPLHQGAASRRFSVTTSTSTGRRGRDGAPPTAFP